MAICAPRGSLFECVTDQPTNQPTDKASYWRDLVHVNMEQKLFVNVSYSCKFHKNRNKKFSEKSSKWDLAGCTNCICLEMALQLRIASDKKDQHCNPQSCFFSSFYSFNVTEWRIWTFMQHPWVWSIWSLSQSRSFSYKLVSSCFLQVRKVT